MARDVSPGTAILVDPGAAGVGVDLDLLVTSLRGLGFGQTMLVPGLARHPERLTGAVKGSGARRAVVVTADFGRPSVAELRMWGQAGGLDPLGVRVVALDILRSRRSPTERSAYAVRMVRSAVAALNAPGTADAVRAPVGALLSRRALLKGRATTWVPVVGVDTRACLGMGRCGRCVQVCPQGALQISQGVLGAAPAVDASRCGACSWCLDVCPTGALSLDGHEPGTLAKRLQALLKGGDGAGPPALVIACQSAVEPLHRLGERGALPGWLVLELACLGGVGSTWHLAALAAGAPTVQVLPCARCRERVNLSEEIRFTRALLSALGDVYAARRVGVLPAGGPRLRRAVLGAGGLTALVEGTGAALIPTPGRVQTSARVAAWAVRHLQEAMGALAAPAQEALGAQAGALGAPVRDRAGRHVVITGDGAPLGVARAAGGCTACGVCARSCPTRALSLSPGVGSAELVLDPAACTGCGVCVPACPEQVLDVVKGVDLDLLGGGSLTIARVTVATCPDCGQSVPALPAAGHLTPLPAQLASRCPPCRQAALVASS